jgi:hypothetical protein
MAKYAGLGLRLDLNFHEKGFLAENTTRAIRKTSHAKLCQQPRKKP